MFQHGGRRRSSSARVYKFSLLCSGFASISGTTSGKNEMDIFTPVHAVETPLNTCRASRACRDERVAPCCPTSATHLVTSRYNFYLYQNAWARQRRNVTSQVEFGLKQKNRAYAQQDLQGGLALSGGTAIRQNGLKHVHNLKRHQSCFQTLVKTFLFTWY